MVRRRKAGSRLVRTVEGSKEKLAVPCSGQGPIAPGTSPAKMGSLSGIQRSSFSFLGSVAARSKSALVKAGVSSFVG
ncbi:hypothetical protein NL676_012318 [Syzygium grande]|nr:hypothetical protein NL676_012318 [Syzygium grande]